MYSQSFSVALCGNSVILSLRMKASVDNVKPSLESYGLHCLFKLLIISNTEGHTEKIRPDRTDQGSLP
jgi:hypothetical protein